MNKFLIHEFVILVCCIIGQDCGTLCEMLCLTRDIISLRRVVSAQDVTSMQLRSLPKTNRFLHNFLPPYLPFSASLLARSFCIALQQGTADILHPFTS